MKHILIIASYGPSLINFRLSLIKELLSKGHKVSVASPIDNFSKNLRKLLKDLGIKIYTIKLSRTGINFFSDFKTLLEIYNLIKKISPNIIISYTVKPVIYTGLILNFFRKITFYPLITGLGSSFTEINSIKKFLLKYLIIQLYRQGLKNSSKVIFQNKDDKSLFLKLKVINQRKSYVVNGSGVSLRTFPFTKLPTKPVFLMVSRLLFDKGIREYVEAAKIVRSKFPNAKFKLVGGFDQNPSSISFNELKLWKKDRIIEYLGKLKTVQSALRSCKYFVLPSYREGTPRSTLEALAMGRPIITTNVPGCRETVIHNKNGLLVPPKNITALARAMISLMEEDDKVLRSMGRESYFLAKKKYEISKVNKSILNIMKL